MNKLKLWFMEYWGLRTSIDCKYESCNKCKYNKICNIVYLGVSEQ